VPDLLSPANFDFFARYLLAGFILMSVRSWFISTQRPKPAETLFDAVILSLINQLVFLLIAYLLIAPATQFLPPRISSFLMGATGGRAAFFFEVLLLPALLGAMFGSALARDWHVALLRRFAMPNVHPTQRAYDYAFSEQPGPSFLIVTYKDGTQVFGYFGDRSLAATDDRRSDIYLERLYSVDDGGRWSETPTPRSALLMLDDIRSIEFIAVGDTGSG
jgi:hypothetical protein